MIRFMLALAATAALFWTATTDTGAQPRPVEAGKPHVPVGWPREVEGYGKTVELAKANAIQNAVERVRACLRNQDPPLLAWSPDEDYVRKHLIEGYPGHQGDDVVFADNKDLTAKRWVQPIPESPNWAEMVQLNQAAQRTELAAERRTLAAYALAGLLAILATGWGYLRLDEWTSGKFSKWLGIGAVAVLAVTGVALVLS